jgi:hypothetical protein
LTSKLFAKIEKRKSLEILGGERFGGKDNALALGLAVLSTGDNKPFKCS